MNPAMLIDFYELTMANGYFELHKEKEIVYFDLFYRKNPDNGGYAVFAGLDSIITYIQDLHFTEKDIVFLRSKKVFSESFLKYLESFSFTGDIYSVKEGTIVFPNEPIMTIKAPLIEAQIIETFLLQTVNHQSLIATKASRIRQSAQDKVVIEMGARRAHGASSSILGARASFIAGIDATSNVLADQLHEVPSGGTMAHSWVQSFEKEIEAFEAYCKIYPHNITLLIDTYDTLESGLPNAILVLQKHLRSYPDANISVRLDSGDLGELAFKVREELDNHGLHSCKIIASNSLDEFTIKEMLDKKTPIDIFGVGERLITSKSDPVFGAVYKLVAKEVEQGINPIIKVSDTIEKTTTPHYKKLYRLIRNNEMVKDVIAIYDEEVSKEYTLLHETIFKNGNLVYQVPKISTIKDYVSKQINMLGKKYKLFTLMESYPVELSEQLKKVKSEMTNHS